MSHRFTRISADQNRLERPGLLAFSGTGLCHPCLSVADYLLATTLLSQVNEAALYGGGSSLSTIAHSEFAKNTIDVALDGCLTDT